MRHLERLARKIAQKEDHLANFRLTFFSLAAGAALAGMVRNDWRPVAYNVAFLFFAAFIVMVWKHHGVKEKQVRVEHRKRLEQDLKSISQHDWEKMPSLYAFDTTKLPSYFHDLDLFEGHSLFRLLSHVISTGGMKRLITRFGDSPIPDEEILRRQEATRTVARHRVLRRKFLVAARAEAGWIDSDRLLLLSQEKSLLKKGATTWLLFHSSIYATAWILLFASLLFGVKPYFLFASFGGLLTYSLFAKRIDVTNAYDFALSLSFSLGKLESVFRILERFATGSKSGLDDILAPFKQGDRPSRQIRRLDRVIGALGVRQNYLVHLVVHLIAPWDFLWTYLLDRRRQDLEKSLPAWLDAHSEFEVCVSLAEFQFCFPHYVMPTLLAQGDVVIEAHDLKHPLLDPTKAVGNNVTLSAQQKCVLITGSNMSGKSTYLRSSGIGLLLARAGAPVPAKDFKFKNAIAATSLKRTDSLEDGLSSFYAEVIQLKTILDESRSDQATVYLIDEVLRGTNNRERLIGSRHYLGELLQTRACGIITTHDLELSELEKFHPDVKNYHFSDEIIDKHMVFHYKLQPGACTTTNALRVMKMAGLYVSSET